MTRTDLGSAASANGVKAGVPMNVYVTSDSDAGRAYEKARGLPIDPNVLAPGLPQTPIQDLVFHGGKTIHDLHFVNFYLGGKSSWDLGEVKSIDQSIDGAMSDRQLNNVMTQYFDDDNISSKFDGSEILEVDTPPTFFSDTGEKLVEDLHSEGKLDNFDLESTVFNFILPKKVVLKTKLRGRTARSTQKKPDHNDDDNDEDGEKPFFPEVEANSLRGLGGYHGSIHVGTGEGRKTIYYSFNVYSETMDDGRTNGIPVFDENWKNIVATLYHELNEARTDPDVADVINGGPIDLLGWNSRKGQECGDFPVEEAFRAGNPGLVMKEVTIDGNQIVPIQLQYSNFVHGPEGRIPNPHPRGSRSAADKDTKKDKINIGNGGGNTIGVGVSGPRTSHEKIDRFPYARFPDKVILGEVIHLEVIIKAVKSLSPDKAETTITVTVPSDRTEVPVVVTLEWTNGFDLEGEKYYATIYVPVEPEDSKPVIFDLKSIEEGEQTIVIRFYQQQSYVGQIKIKSLVVHSRDELQVKSAISSSPSAVWTSNKLPEKTLQGPDITIYIQERKVSPDFEFDVLISSPEFPIKEMGPIKFSFNPETKFHEIFEDIENINLPPEIVDRKIKAKGITLYDELFPESLKKLYWEKRDKIKSIRILSKEPWIPWEIIKPWHESENGDIEEDEFLCERYAFSRWIVDGPERIKEHIHKMKIIVPSDTNLVKALEERDWIKEFGNSRQRIVSFDRTYQQVINTFETGEFDLLHFSTHGQSNNENPLFSVIELEDRIQLRPEDISGVARKFGQSSPVVVMNACQTGNQGFSLTGIEGWAERFLSAGASVFVGTLWSISDEIAFKFVKELYGELSSGTTLGEAVKKARIKCKISGDPSWLAYQLYGHPNVTISF